MIKIDKKTALMFFAVIAQRGLLVYGDFSAFSEVLPLFEFQRIAVVALLFLMTVMLSFYESG